MWALAEALRVEYEAIVNAGFLLQIDDAWTAALWDRIGVGMGLDAFKARCFVRVEALNHALRHVPEDRVRYHFCWGSWHGPHAFDLPMADLVDVMLAVKARFYSFEAANVRHEHEYHVWERVTLPPGKVILPGVVTHSTDLIEHPGAGVGTHPALCPARGPGAGDRELRLRLRRPHPSADRLGEAPRAEPGCRARQPGPGLAEPLARPGRGKGSCSVPAAMTAQLRLVAVLAAFASVSCTTLAERRQGSPALPSRNDNARADVLARAQVWRPTTIAAMDVLAGPQRPDSFPRNAMVVCDYLDKKLAGLSPKFACKRGEDDERQGEVRRHQRRGLWRSARHAPAVGARVRRRRHVSGQRRLPGMPAGARGNRAAGQGVSLRSRRDRAQDARHRMAVWRGRRLGVGRGAANGAARRRCAEGAPRGAGAARRDDSAHRHQGRGSSASCAWTACRSRACATTRS